MKVAVLTSNSLRHTYFANTLDKNFDLVGIVTEPKHDYFDQQKKESAIVEEHFENLRKYEQRYLGKYEKFPQCPILEIEAKEINNEATLQWVSDKKPDYICLFGTNILKENWLSVYSDKIINLHLGLSPYYKGAATLFWPFANDDLACVGVTIHIATKDVDAGAILTQVRPNLAVGDNYYDITSKVIKESIEHFSKVLCDYEKSIICPMPQIVTDHCRLYKKNDFNETVLNHMLSKYAGGLSKKDITNIERSVQCLVSK